MSDPTEDFKDITTETVHNLIDDFQLETIGENT